MSPARPGSGFCLLEQLIGLAILSIGLLGSTRMFGEALQSLRDDTHHQSAIVLGEELLERLVASGAARESVRFSCAPGVAPCRFDAPIEIADWQASLQRSLPEPDTQLRITPAARTNAVTLSISWRDSRGQTVIREFERIVSR